MGNCLVTKLKSNVSADLPILGELKGVVVEATPSDLALKFTAIQPNSVKCKIVSDNATFGAVGGNAVKINDKEVYLGTTLDVYFNVSEKQDVELVFENYYGITYANINSALCSMNSAEFKYFNNLNTLFLVRAANITGTIGDFALESINKLFIEAVTGFKLNLDGIEKFNNTPLTQLSVRAIPQALGGILALKNLSPTKRSDIVLLDIQATMNDITILSDFSTLFPNLTVLNIADLSQFNGQNFEDAIRGFVSSGRTSGSLSLYAVRSGILFNGVAIDGDGVQSNMTWEPASAGYTSVTWKGTTIQIQNS